MSSLASPFRDRIARLQAAASELPQLELATEHYFANGMYVRKVTRPAGATIVGKVHKHEHLFVLLYGELEVVTDEGTRRMHAGDVLVSKPGTKRATYALVDSCAMTVHRTELTDLEAIEREIIEEDPAALFDAHNRIKNADQEDYRRVVAESGYTHEEIQRFCTNAGDQIPMPAGFNLAEVRDSPIHGKGLFATMDLEAGALIAPARIGDRRTPAGRYTNHAKNPNVEYVLHGDNIYLMSLVRIAKGSELTVNYRHTALFSGYQFRRLK